MIGGSAGGSHAIKSIIRHLKPDLPAAVFVVLHTHHQAPPIYSRVFSDIGPLPAVYATHKQTIEPGRIYLAPPNQHLLVKKDRIVLSLGPHENLCRPAIDPLFRSAAVAHQVHVIGVVVSGLQDDGAAGLYAVKRCGGFTMVQDPDDAEFPDMPHAARECAEVDFVGVPERLAEQINRLAVTAPPDRTIDVPQDLQLEANIAERIMSNLEEMPKFGDPIFLSCPSCSGPLWLKKLPRGGTYRCHVGHAFSANTLLLEQDGRIEKALWTALRTLEERRRMLHSMLEQARVAEQFLTVEILSERAKQASEEVRNIQEALQDLDRVKHKPLPPE